MMLKPISIFAGFFVSGAVAIYIVGTQFSEPPSVEPATVAMPSSVHGCGTDTSVNPYTQPDAGCKDKSAAHAAPVAPVASNTGDAATVGKNRRELALCDSQNKRCKNTTPAQAKLVTQLEDMSSKGNPQARYELARQLQRQEQGSDIKMPTADEVANNRNLQRSVALLAEAIAAGNEDAQKLRDSMGDQARILHTGR